MVYVALKLVFLITRLEPGGAEVVSGWSLWVAPDCLLGSGGLYCVVCTRMHSALSEERR